MAIVTRKNGNAARQPKTGTAVGNPNRTKPVTHTAQQDNAARLDDKSVVDEIN